MNLHLPALPARVALQPPSRRSLCSNPRTILWQLIQTQIGSVLQGILFEQEFFGLFRAEMVSAYDWRNRIGDFRVADYLVELDTVHVVRLFYTISLHLSRTSSSPPNQR